MIQSVEPWMSSEDIRAGATWNTEIADKLDASEFGVICVTAENLSSPWLNFEAGALSKRFGGGVTRVAPLLINLTPSQITGPLKEFQQVQLERDDMRRLVIAINDALGEARLDGRELDDAFDVWWPGLEERLRDLPDAETAPPEPRDQREILEELLLLVRQLERDRQPPPGLAKPITKAISVEGPLDRNRIRVRLRKLMAQYVDDPDWLEKVRIPWTGDGFVVHIPPTTNPTRAALREAIAVFAEAEGVRMAVRFRASPKKDP